MQLTPPCTDRDEAAAHPHTQAPHAQALHSRSGTNELRVPCLPTTPPHQPHKPQVGPHAPTRSASRASSLRTSTASPSHETT